MQQIQTIEKCSGQTIVYLDYLVVLSLNYPRHGSLSCITKYLSKTIIFQAHVRLWCDVCTGRLKALLQIAPILNLLLCTAKTMINFKLHTLCGTAKPFHADFPILKTRMKYSELTRHSTSPVQTMHSIQKTLVLYKSGVLCMES